MLANNGTYQFYKIQIFIGDEWRNFNVCGPDDFGEKSFHKGTLYYEYSASGDCWQDTGVNGFYNFHHAKMALMKVREAYPSVKFRLAKFEISQSCLPLWGL